jgi:hypothetical protein
MPRHNTKAPEKKSSTSNRLLSFQLSWGGLAGLAVVLFFLFLWMFLLGIWAGQTFLAPGTKTTRPPQEDSSEFFFEDFLNEELTVEVLRPRARKRRIAPQEIPILQAE